MVRTGIGVYIVSCGGRPLLLMFFGYIGRPNLRQGQGGDLSNKSVVQLMLSINGSNNKKCDGNDGVGDKDEIGEGENNLGLKVDTIMNNGSVNVDWFLIQ
ncbi:MAG: hypothetical protein Ta2E_10330 [Mycoplasmoidaceae bacterium]|nr:MAG: hypothetical protein Ta2E_10330 [Mycoplasmoidaceae bacterium]